MHRHFLILQLLFLTLTPLSINGLTFLQSEILDLESNTAYFETEVSHWTSTNTLSTFASTQCGGTWLLGGYGVTTTSTTFSRDYSSLPSHNEIYFSFYTWYIDLHQQADLFEIYIDNQLIQDLTSYAYTSFSPPADYCGLSFKDYVGSRVDGKVMHSASALNFKLVLKSGPPTNDFSIGFRQLSLLFYTSSVPTTSVCQVQSPIYSSGISCFCPLGQYDIAGFIGCAMCASNCRTCAGPSSTDCTSCPVGYSYNGATCFACDSSCLQCKGTGVTDCVRCSSSSFLYWNGTCQSSCTAPLVTSSEGEYQNCSLPCGSDFYFENSTCGSTCPSGDFTQVSYGDLKLCNFKCPGGSDYLYSNGSCLASCPSPFISSVQGAEKYCDFPCAISSDYLYENGSCYSHCDSPFLGVSFGAEKYCNFPCGSSNYLYENGSCSSICPIPLSILIRGAEKYCNLPCLTSEFFHLKSQKCVSTCPSPSEVVMINSVQGCKSNSTVESTTQTFGGFLEYIFTGSNIIGGIIRPNNLNSAFMVALAKLLKYVQYLDVPFPQEIRDQLHPNGTSAGFCITQMFSYAMPESLKEQFPQHPLPYYIAQTGVHSSYLVNHWQTISTYLFLFVLAIVFTGLEKITIWKLPEWKGLIVVVTRLRILLKWNFLLFAFFNTYDDLVFFAILELKTLHLNSGLSILSFVICLVTSSIAIFLLYKAWVSCKESLQQREKKVGDIDSPNHPAMVFYKKWEDFQVLYAGLRRNSKMKQYYLFIYTMRIIFCYLVAGLLYEYPRLQTVQYLFWSVFMMFLLLRYRPILDPFAYFVNLTYETLILVVNVCLVALAGYSTSGDLSESMQYGLSKTVLICNSLVYFFSNLFSWIYILTGFILAYKINKKKGLNAKTVWLSVPVSPYSNPGMDYDDLTYLDTTMAESSSYPQRTRIAKNRIIPLNLAGDSDIEASLKNILSSVQRDSRSFLVVQRDTSDGQSSVAFCKNFENVEISPEFTRRNEHTFRHSMYSSQVKFLNNKRKGSGNSEDGGPNENNFRLQKDLSLSIEDAHFVKIDLNKVNREGTSDFFNGNVSTYNNTHSFLKSPSGSRPLGHPNSIIIESLELENSSNSQGQRNRLISPILRNDSPILHLGNFNQRGSLCATYLASNLTPMSRRRSLFGRETNKGAMNFQQVEENLEASPLSFLNNSSSVEKFPPRKISRNEEMSLSIDGKKNK